MVERHVGSTNNTKEEDMTDIYRYLSFGQYMSPENNEKSVDCYNNGESNGGATQKGNTAVYAS